MVGGVIRIVTTIYKEELCGLSWSVCGTTTGSLSYFSSLVTAAMITSSLPMTPAYRSVSPLAHTTLRAGSTGEVQRMEMILPKATRPEGVKLEFEAMLPI